jgi:hypothetical protein
MIAEVISVHSIGMTMVMPMPVKRASCGWTSPI